MRLNELTILHAVFGRVPFFSVPIKYFLKYPTDPHNTVKLIGLRNKKIVSRMTSKPIRIKSNRFNRNNNILHKPIRKDG